MSLRKVDGQNWKIIMAIAGFNIQFSPPKFIDWLQASLIIIARADYFYAGNLFCSHAILVKFPALLESNFFLEFYCFAFDRYFDGNNIFWALR